MNVRWALPWKIVRRDAAGPIGAETPPKKTRTVTVDMKREGDVVGRIVRWRFLKDNPRHLDAIAYVGATSQYGQMSLEAQRHER